MWGLLLELFIFGFLCYGNWNFGDIDVLIVEDSYFHLLLFNSCLIDLVEETNHLMSLWVSWFFSGSHWSHGKITKPWSIASKKRGIYISLVSIKIVHFLKNYTFDTRLNEVYNTVAFIVHYRIRVPSQSSCDQCTLPIPHFSQLFVFL